MTDLVDYLRDKLEHANDVVCRCGTVDISTPGDPNATVKGYSRHCPVHGVDGSEPDRSGADVWRSVYGRRP